AARWVFGRDFAENSRVWVLAGLYGLTVVYAGCFFVLRLIKGRLRYVAVPLWFLLLLAAGAGVGSLIFAPEVAFAPTLANTPIIPDIAGLPSIRLRRALDAGGSLAEQTLTNVSLGPLTIAKITYGTLHKYLSQQETTEEKALVIWFHAPKGTAQGMRFQA